MLPFYKGLMEELLQFAGTNIHLAPLIIFSLLLLAGFNLPVSEDLMLFTSAILAVKNPEHLWPLFIGVFAGAYFSDLIAYSLGRFLGPKLWNIKMFAKMVKPEQVDKVSAFYKKYGVITLILGRFIPFGVRNALFITAGLGKMRFLKFALSDLLACTISCSIFFYLYFNFGEKVIDIIKKGNMVIFAVFITFIIYYLFNKKRSTASKSA